MHAKNESWLSMFDDESALVYGIGNVGRRDDGLGWAFVDRLEAAGLCQRAEKLKFYHLNLEDADLLSRKRRVLFIDASREAGLDSFRLYRPKPRMDFSFTSHAMSVETVMATCEQCYATLPEVHVLAIRGYEWELETGLTRRAQDNLAQAFAQLQCA